MSAWWPWALFKVCTLFHADCLSKLLPEQISTEIHEGPTRQSVWPLLQRAEEERCEDVLRLRLWFKQSPFPKTLSLVFTHHLHPAKRCCTSAMSWQQVCLRRGRRVRTVTQEQPPTDAQQPSTLCCLPKHSSSKHLETSERCNVVLSGTHLRHVSVSAPGPSFTGPRCRIMTKDEWTMSSRWLNRTRAPLAAVYIAARRAKGAGRGCGSSWKTRCFTPTEPKRWGDPCPPLQPEQHAIHHMFCKEVAAAGVCDKKSRNAQMIWLYSIIDSFPP